MADPKEQKAFLKKLVKRGKDVGFLTEEDILEEIPYIEEDPLFLDEVFKILQENDIEDS
jgi:hypothetical protein